MTPHPGVAWGFIPDTMKKRVLCLLSDGFEEVEFVTPVDILRRAGVEVVSAGMKERMATGRNGIRIEADVMIDDVDPLSFDLLFLPGGPGVGALREDGRAAGIARDFHDAGKLVAAICAAPLILKDAGLLEGRSFTAFHSVRDELGDGVVEARVVEDGNLITSRGAGTALEFALALAAALAGSATAVRVSEEIMV